MCHPYVEATTSDVHHFFYSFPTVDDEFETVSTQLLKRTQAMLNKYRLLLLEESRVRLPANSIEIMPYCSDNPVLKGFLTHVQEVLHAVRSVTY